MVPKDRMMWLLLLVCVMVMTGEAVPTQRCETAGQRIADKDSCTRYHICREDDGQFHTDIAICRSDKLFDMVTLTCIDRKHGYAQDPNSCVEFYGCQLPSSNKKAEGLVRKHYKCTGNLRYHPQLGKCTYKILVPDTLCNNRVSSQQILGQNQQDIPTTTTTTTTTTPTTTTTTTTTPTTTTSTTTTTTTEDGPAGDTRLAGLALPPSEVSDLERIAQVIKGQLLTRRKTPTIVNRDSQANREAQIPSSAKD